MCVRVCMRADERACVYLHYQFVLLVCSCQVENKIPGYISAKREQCCTNSGKHQSKWNLLEMKECFPLSMHEQHVRLNACMP